MPRDNGEVALRTVASTAKYLGLGRTKIYDLCKSGELEAVKLGDKSKRITQTSIDSYIKNAKRIAPKHKPEHPDEDDKGE